MSNGKNITKPSKRAAENAEAEAVSRYSKAAYFQEKDRKATEFLKNIPYLKNFLNRLSKVFHFGLPMAGFTDSTTCNQQISPAIRAPFLATSN